MDISGSPLWVTLSPDNKGKGRGYSILVWSPAILKSLDLLFFGTDDENINLVLLSCSEPNSFANVRLNKHPRLHFCAIVLTSFFKTLFPDSISFAVGSFPLLLPFLFFFLFVFLFLLPSLALPHCLC